MPLIEIESASLTSLGAFPLSFKVEEALSCHPYYTLEFQCPEADIDLASLLGEGVVIHIERPDGGTRPFFAYTIAGFDQGQRENQFVYKLELSTWVWFLMQNRNCRIFQDLSIIDIIEQVFSHYNFADYYLDVEGIYTQREYCVQFAETDFNFISRLMEDEGVWYYFTYLDGKNTLVITDRQDFAPLSDGYDELPFLPDSEEMRAIREGVQRLQRSRRVLPSEVVLRDFDYRNPRNMLQTKVEQPRVQLQGIPLEWYDYAAGYTDTDRGEWLARLRLEAMQSESQLLSGESNAVGLSPGREFTLYQHPDASRNRGFKLIRCDYLFLQDGPDSSSRGRNVTCKFIALNDDVPYRPERKTPRPQLAGIQSATVVGAVQSEVHTDKFARIRVHFHWDRYKSTEEDSSCWIRVVQAWAGKGWGVLAMPRVGQEVLITYVDGDLDRPMVTGIVYNGDNPPPYKLPENINYTGLVSRSLKFGKPQQASQLTFDDNRGSERVMLHAERDFQHTVERNSIHLVGNDVYKEVSGTTTNWLSDHVSYKSVTFSLLGMGANVVGFNASFTGSNLSMTGVNVGFIGCNTSFVGVGTSIAGVNASFTGASTSITGKSVSCTGVADSVTGTSNSYTTISDSVTVNSNSLTVLSTSTTGVSISDTATSISTTGFSASTTLASLSNTAASISITGISISKTDSSNSFVGNSISATLSSLSTTGCSISATGSSIAVNGSSISANGSSIAVNGLSLSYNGVQLAEVGQDLKQVGMQCKN